MKNGKVRVFVKGGPEIVIEHCNKMLTSQSEAAPMGEKERSEILGEKVVKKFAGQCYRTLLVAYVDFTDAEW
jgi:magnesium-transporting ATPase (P-type)